MNVRLASQCRSYVAALATAICGNSAVAAEEFRSEAELFQNFYLAIPALKVDDKFYQVGLEYHAPVWTLHSAVSISPVDSDYVSGSYANGVLDLACVNYNGNIYAARLAHAAAGTYSFTLVSATKLASCPIPADIGPVRGKWLRTADAPLSARSDASLAWTGAEILVLGGSTFFCPPLASCAAPTTPPFRDGAAYNPLTDSWREIAVAPAGVTGRTVTVGTDVFVFGQTLANAPFTLLRYRTTQDGWEELELPLVSPDATFTAYGNDLLLYPQTDQTGSAADWRFDTATGQWMQLPEHPLGPGFSRQYVAHGEDLYLFDKALTPSPGGADGPSFLRAARLRGLQWQVLPGADSIGSAPDLIAGTRLIAPVLGCADGGQTNGYGRCIPYGAVFDTETDTWHELPNAPGRGIKHFAASGGVSHSDLSLRSTGRPALDATTNEWFLVPQLDADKTIHRSIQAAGPYGFAFGGVSTTGTFLNTAWIWVP